MAKEDFIPVAEPLIGPREVELVTDCVKSTWVSSLGPYISRFEREFADFCGVRHGVTTSNGTSALHLALAVLDIGPGDEVIVPTLTFAATANAVAYTGATPICADSDPYTWTIDPWDVEARINDRTKAIIVVHLYGHPADMAPILSLARRHDLRVIEDAAEAHGALYRDRRVGSLSDISIFSFYANKVITTGEGGMLLTDNANWAQRAASLRDHGMSPERRYWHPVIGYNYRLTNMQAALGVAQMERINEFVAAKRRNAALYSSHLRSVPGVTLPPEAPWATSVYWMYSILIDPEYGPGRDELMAHLRTRGVDSRPFFHPIHTLPPYVKGQVLPVAEDLASRGLNLPSAVTLREEDIARVCAAVAEVVRPMASTPSVHLMPRYALPLYQPSGR